MQACFNSVMNNTTGPLVRVQGAAMIAAPLLLVASSASYAAGGGIGADQLGGTIQIYAMAAFALALLGVTRTLDHAKPRAAAVLSVMAVLGAAGGVAYGVDAVHTAVHPEGPIDAMTAGPLILNAPGLTFPLSLIGIGITLATSGVASRWSGYLLVAGGVLFPLSRIPGIVQLALVSDLIILAGLAPLGWAILRGGATGTVAWQRGAFATAPIAALVAALAVPAVAVAQSGPPPPPPVAMTAEFAALRTRFEPMTPAQVQAAGYVIPAPVCVSSPLGGMGYHAMHFARHAQQFQSGRMDPTNPPILLIGGDGRVIGLEWEANQRAAPQVLFGQAVRILSGHEGLEEPHYMLHAYFRPNGQVLFADFDPAVTCPPPGTLPAGYQIAQPGAPGAQVAAPSVQVQLPRTGIPASPSALPWLLAVASSAGIAGVVRTVVVKRRR